jgi:hypothetical protein
MKALLIVVSLLNVSAAWGQAHPKPTLKKSVAHAKHPVSAAGIPTTALANLSRVLLYQCADGGNDFIRAFVYQAYMRNGARYRYEVDEQLGKLTTSKKSRDTILEAISTRCGGDRDSIMDNLYSALGMNMASAKTLTQYIMQNYHQPEPDRNPEGEAESQVH